MGGVDFQWSSSFTVSGGSSGGLGLAAQVCAECNRSLNSPVSYSSDFSSWAAAMGSLRSFEVAIPSSNQSSDWMSSRRSMWVDFTNNGSNHHAAGFATALLACEVNINGSAQCGWDRSSWVTRCRAMGGVDMQWYSNFTVSGGYGSMPMTDLDRAKQAVAQCNSSLNSTVSYSADFSSWSAAMGTLRSFEVAIPSASQSSDWMSSKRSIWVDYTNNSNYASPAGFATALLACEVNINGSAQGSWDRSAWVQSLRSMGGTDFVWQSQSSGK